MKKEYVLNAKRHTLFPLVNDTAINGNTRAGLTLNTEVRLNKFYVNDDGVKVPNPHYGKVRKIQVVSVMLATEKTISAFQTATRREQEKAGETPNFEVQDHRYADQIEGSAIWVHRDNGQAYLRYFPNSINKVNAQYLLDGKPVDYSELLGKPAPRKLATTDNGVVKPQIRNAKLESVTGIRVNGQDVDLTTLA
jgi:hypothetical protein